jgi:hypothetical protein
LHCFDSIVRFSQARF